MLKYLRYFGTHILITATTIGLVAGGAWSWLGLGVGFIFWVGGDSLSRTPTLPSPHYAHPRILDTALYSLFVPVIVMTLAFAWALSNHNWFGFGTWIHNMSGIDVLAGRANNSLADVLGASLSFGLAMAMGGILTAHELGHRTDDRWAMWVARWMLAMAFNASLEVAHVFGHHRDVGTPADPATARRGESIYHFYIRSTAGQFFQAWRIERERFERLGQSLVTFNNKVIAGLLRAGLVAVLFYLTGGPYALGAFLVASMWNKFLLESLNYIEHYGLVRVPGEPINPRHAWDSLSSFSHAALFELPWHADHHSRVGCRYPELRASPNAPLLPFGYLAALPIVWIPPLWKRLIKNGLAEWDRNKASSAERSLI